MRRFLALVGVLPILATLTPATPAAAGAAYPAVPEPAASPPLGNDYFTPAQLARGLISAPKGYTQLNQGSGSVTNSDVFASGICNGGFATTIWESITYAWRSFRHTDGSILMVTVKATGAARAREVVRHAAEPPAACPIAVGGGTTTTYTKLPLPALGDAAAGYTELTESAGATAKREHAAAVALGNVSAVFEDRGGDQARFLGTVKAGAGKLRRINAAPAVSELKRGLMEVTDLPTGHRLVGDTTLDNKEVFTELDCAGKPLRFGPSATAVRRTFAMGKTDPAVQITAGWLGAAPAQSLVTAIRKRLTDCPAVTDEAGTRHPITDLPVPATDITVVGALYTGSPTIARTLVVYRDIALEFRITGADTTEAQKIVEAGMGRIFQINA
jgi:hypothetical protein